MCPVTSSPEPLDHTASHGTVGGGEQFHHLAGRGVWQCYMNAQVHRLI